MECGCWHVSKDGEGTGETRVPLRGGQAQLGLVVLIALTFMSLVKREEGGIYIPKPSDPQCGVFSEPSVSWASVSSSCERAPACLVCLRPSREH